MAEDFPNLGKDLDIQVHETHKPPNKLKEILSRTVKSNKPAKNQGQRGDLKSRERNEACNLLGAWKSVSRFLSKTLTG